MCESYGKNAGSHEITSARPRKLSHDCTVARPYFLGLFFFVMQH